ncbi:MAG: hypothetical protein U9P44_03055 [archaeon]|nr:hypothetical protein [archaeon]
MSIFRAYDIRGIYGDDLTDEIMENIGSALAALMKSKNMGKNILVGADIRESSLALLEAFIRGAVKGGINVTNAGVTSFGIALYSGWKLKKDVTAYITASHNPSEWNGIKFYDKDCVGFFEDMNSELGVLAGNKKFQEVKVKGNTDTVNMKDEYVDYLCSRFHVAKPLDVVVDCGNGSTCHSAPSVFSLVENINPLIIFDNVDPSFSGRGADVEEENLRELKKKAVKVGASFGAAFDGDGDRVAIVDDKGRALNSDQIAFVLAKSIFSGVTGGTMIVNVECSMAIEKEMEAIGVRVVRIPVGHTYMMQSARDEKALLGEETAFHFVLSEYFPFDDAIVVPLKLAEMLSQSDKKLSELVDAYPIHPKKRISVDCADDIKFSVIEDLRNKFRSEYDKVNVLDGVRVDFDDGWVLVRVSNTAPIIRITSEAVDEKTMNHFLDKYSAILKKEIKNMAGSNLSGAD